MIDYYSIENVAFIDALCLLQGFGSIISNYDKNTGFKYKFT